MDREGIGIQGGIIVKRETHGVLGLGLAALALAAAAQSLFQQSMALGVAYLLLGTLSVPVILYSFCAKCPDRGKCGHVVPGRAASALYKNRKQGPYTGPDMTMTAAALLVIFGFPQIWLWRHPVAFGAFWILMAVAVADIRSKICRDCGNGNCPGNPTRKQRHSS
jgi:hypothetical protein